MKPAATNDPRDAGLRAERAQTLLDFPRESGQAELFRQMTEARRRAYRRRKKTVAVLSTTAAACLVLVVWVMPLVRDTKTIAAPIQARRTVTIADGSTVELNAQSRLETDFRHCRRVARLTRGEAFFSVVADPSLPFSVQTAAGVIRVLGTSFNVRVDDGVEVTLTQGAVQVQPASQAVAAASIVLSPGQQFRSANGVVRTVASAELDSVMAWRDGRIAFDGLTLSEAAARLSNYHGRTIAVDAEIASLHPGGSIPIADLPVVLHALESALAVRVVAMADGSFRIVAR